jgi:hypothetical protein
MPDLIRHPEHTAGIQNILKSLDSGYRITSGTGPAGMTLLWDSRLFTKPSILLSILCGIRHT